MRRIVCIGNMTNDIILRVNELPKLDDVAYVNNYTKCMGGRGAIVAIALASLHSNCSYITSIPDNQIALKYCDFLKENGVNINGVFTDHNCQEMYEVYIAVTKTEENCISFFKPANLNFIFTEEQKKVCEKGEIFYFSTHYKKFNIEILEYLKNSEIENKKIIHNISNYFFSSNEYINMMLETSNILIGNSLEMNELIEKLNFQNTESLLKTYPNIKTVFVTHGKEGSEIYSQQQKEFVIAKDAESTSPVGAGDSYSAGIVYGISNGWTNIECANFASELAAISVESTTSYPDLVKVKKLRKVLEDR